MESQEVPKECPGTKSEQAGHESACQGCPNQGVCQTMPKEPTDQQVQAQDHINKRLSKIKHKLLIMSGKGGVGKSTFSTLIAQCLASMNFEVGLLDLDLCGPSIPQTTNLSKHEVHQSADGWEPVYCEDNLAVMSVGFLLSQQDDPVIWRGPKKNGLIQQFVGDVNWGELDFLVIDTPPGTSDEHISITQLIQMDPQADGVVLISTGQRLSVNDVRKQIRFCQKTQLRVLGMVDNMSQLDCPNCDCKINLFYNKEDPVKQMCNDYGIEQLGAVSFSPVLLDQIENGINIFSPDVSPENDKLLQKIKISKQKLINVFQIYHPIHILQQLLLIRIYPKVYIPQVIDVQNIIFILLKINH